LVGSESVLLLLLIVLLVARHLLLDELVIFCIVGKGKG
jgi:hypothetical protein